MENSCLDCRDSSYGCYLHRVIPCIDCGQRINSGIFCDCDAAKNRRFKDIQRSKMLGVLDELIEKKEAVAPIKKEFDFPCPNLSPCGYGHPPGVSDECEPDYRRCRYCWKCWCGICGSGLGSIFGHCEYDKCRDGGRNNLRG